MAMRVQSSRIDALPTRSRAADQRDDDGSRAVDGCDDGDASAGLEEELHQRDVSRARLRKIASILYISFSRRISHMADGWMVEARR
jgi:hypothetical protein